MPRRSSASREVETGRAQDNTTSDRPGPWPALVLAALIDLQAVGGLLAARSLTLSTRDEAEQIGYLAQRVRRHTESAMRALDGERSPAGD